MVTATLTVQNPDETGPAHYSNGELDLTVPRDIHKSLGEPTRIHIELTRRPDEEEA